MKNVDPKTNKIKLKINDEFISMALVFIRYFILFLFFITTKNEKK